MAASVVVLPEPVAPVTKTMPVFSLMISLKMGGRLRLSHVGICVLNLRMTMTSSRSMGYAGAGVGCAPRPPGMVMFERIEEGATPLGAGRFPGVKFVVGADDGCMRIGTPHEQFVCQRAR